LGISGTWKYKYTKNNRTFFVCRLLVLPREHAGLSQGAVAAKQEFFSEDSQIIYTFETRYQTS
jgi:hypothetical protein